MLEKVTDLKDVVDDLGLSSKLERDEEQGKKGTAKDKNSGRKSSSPPRSSKHPWDIFGCCAESSR